MKIQGKVWKFGDHVDTDLIIPARYLNDSNKEVLATRCFRDLRPGFPSQVASGDIVVAGKNFGCGSSREQAAWAIKGTGISVVIAESFARIFYRNAFNIGLPLLESTEATQVLEEGDQVQVDLDSGRISRLQGTESFMAEPIPDFMQDLVRAGGLVPYIQSQKERRAG